MVWYARQPSKISRPREREARVIVPTLDVFCGLAYEGRRKEIIVRPYLCSQNRNSVRNKIGSLSLSFSLRETCQAIKRAKISNFAKFSSAFNERASILKLRRSKRAFRREQRGASAEFSE